MGEFYLKEFFTLQKCLVKIFCSSIVDNSTHYQDAAKIRRVFSQINYDCEIINNSTRHKFIKEIRKIVYNTNLLEYDGLIIIIISNGYKNSIQCYDGIEVRFDHILDYFTDKNCKNLIGKPKLIIFNMNQKSELKIIKIFRFNF